MSDRKNLIPFISLTFLMLQLMSCAPHPNPVATPTIARPNDEVADFDALSAWTFRDLHDSSMPELIIFSGVDYRLDPAWEVESIDYLYAAQARSVFDYRTVERDGDSFSTGSSLIESRAVQQLVESIAHLHPIQAMVAGDLVYDFDPSWVVEITGADGQHVLLFSNSVGNVGSAPWNVLVNGRLYAQYDGSLAEALAVLFGGGPGDLSAHRFQSNRDSVAFASEVRPPPQLMYGFTGLLPIADDFGYRIDAEAGILDGYFEKSAFNSGYGDLVDGAVDNLVRAELVLPGTASVSCAIASAQATGGSTGAMWKFECPLGDIEPGETYHYPIRIELSTDLGERLVTEGVLSGFWGSADDVRLMPPSEEMQKALAADGRTRELLSDHVLAHTRYIAEITSESPLVGRMFGEAILLGQTEVDEVTVRYTVGTPYMIEDGRLTRWDLTRSALDEMLYDIIELALTRRVISETPSVVLNLWYVADNEMPGMTPLENGYPFRYQVNIRSCGGVTAQSLPRSEKPLRAFGFDLDWEYWEPNFILVDGKPVAKFLYLKPGEDARGGLQRVFTPDQLDMSGNTPFDIIRLDAAPYSSGRSTLTLSIPETSGASDLAAYERTIYSLPGTINYARDLRWTVEGVTVVVTADGRLKIVPC